MNRLTRTQMIALAVAFGLAIVGVVMVQQFNGKLGDAIGLMSVVAGVLVAALTNMGTDAQ